MSAELLRRAAALVRERAEAATPGPWEASNCESSSTHQRRVFGNYTLVHDGGQEVAIVRGNWKNSEVEPPDAEHIASWHPAVALAVADLLDRAADDHDETPCPAVDAALAVARTYLGEPA